MTISRKSLRAKSFRKSNFFLRQAELRGEHYTSLHRTSMQEAEERGRRRMLSQFTSVMCSGGKYIFLKQQNVSNDS